MGSREEEVYRVRLVGFGGSEPALEKFLAARILGPAPPPTHLTHLHFPTHVGRDAQGHFLYTQWYHELTNPDQALGHCGENTEGAFMFGLGTIPVSGQGLLLGPER